MYYQKELDFIINVLKKCNLNVEIFDSNAPIARNRIASIFVPEGEDVSFSQVIGGLKDKTFYRAIDVFQCQYVFIKLPSEQVFFVGPYHPDEVTREQILERAESLGYTTQQAAQLDHYYRDVPVVLDNSKIFTMMDAFCEVLWREEDYTYVNIDRSEEGSFSSLLPRAQDLEDVDPIIEREMLERRYAFENQFMDAVSRGQAYKSQMFLDTFSVGSFEQRLSDSVRNARNYMIIMNTLLRKSAEKGGVHPIYLDKMSSKYAKEIENIKTVKSIPSLMKLMFEDYCKMVNKHKTSAYSPLIKNVILYIDSQLAEDFSLKSVAALNGVSPGYLSSCFKAETGKTFVDYVNSQRMDLAKHLIKTTKLQIQTVAQHCGFVDMQYFSKVFKKYTGETPRGYRQAKQNQKNQS